ncbi:NADase-type glycan-binding domain-containing protein [Actinophytocola sp.]|uniref:NADase-type glycan-binding domain-containing protein n=1 Tax=Actinophytocola sp. TaxID=1872138 RepID=UPI003899BB91
MSSAITRGLVVASVVLTVVAAAVTTGVLVALNRVPGMPVAGNATAAPDRRLPATVSPSLLSDSPATIVGASASCTSGPGVDSAGNRFTYEARNAVDGQPATAWRCDHDGVGASLLVTFAQPAVISWIGVVPGFAKTDPYDGTDRYVQGRRVSSARFLFDDGTYIETGFDVSSTSRAMQVVRFPATRTGHVQLVVLASVPGSATNGFDPTDKIAISELAVGA